MSEEEQNMKERLKSIEQTLNFLSLEFNNFKKETSANNPELKQIMESLNVITNVLQISKAPFTLINRTLALNDLIYERFPDLKYDNISKAIVEVLSRKERLNISQLTEQVRKERGSASRRIVRERVDKLIETGVLREVDEGYGRQIELEPIEDEEEN